MRSLREGEVAAALLLDALFGEPPEAVHPTVWIGRAISAFEGWATEANDRRAKYIAGVSLAISLPAFVFISVRALLGRLPRRLRPALEAVLISTSISMRGLAGAAATVERELRAGNLERSRTAASIIVGRDTAALSAPEIARAAVESVAENTSDGVVAPMLYGLFLGAPGALAYRAVNTLDSMVGYRTHPYAELGWASARLDDIANLAPARVTALMVAAISGCPGRTLGITLRYGPLAASPNAGWAEAAFAGALGSKLGGSNSYGGRVREAPVIGEGRPPGPEEIHRSIRLMRRCCVSLAVALGAAASLAGSARRG